MKLFRNVKVNLRSTAKLKMGQPIWITSKHKREKLHLYIIFKSLSIHELGI